MNPRSRCPREMKTFILSPTHAQVKRPEARKRLKQRANEQSKASGAEGLRAALFGDEEPTGKPQVKSTYPLSILLYF